LWHFCHSDVVYKSHYLLTYLLTNYFEHIIPQSVVDIQKLTYSALVLAMLFSTGEAVPLQYYGTLTTAAVATTAAAKKASVKSSRMCYFCDQLTVAHWFVSVSDVDSHFGR